MIVIVVVHVVQSLSSVQLFRNTMDCSPSGSSIHGIFQARTVELVAISFSSITIFLHLHHWKCTVKSNQNYSNDLNRKIVHGKIQRQSIEQTHENFTSIPERTDDIYNILFPYSQQLYFMWTVKQANSRRSVHPLVTFINSKNQQIKIAESEDDEVTSTYEHIKSTIYIEKFSLKTNWQRTLL